MKRIERAKALSFLLFLWSVSAVAQQRYPLNDVLDVYEAQGFRFVYSDSLVRNAGNIELDVSGSLSIRELKTALYSIGLDLEVSKNADGTDTWYLIPSAHPEGQVPVQDRIQGRITDARSGEPLAGVKVEIAGQVVFTDAAGRFLLAAEPLTVLPTTESAEEPALPGSPLQVSRTGYQAVEIPVNERLDSLLEISLESQSRIEEVVVVSSRYALTQSEKGSFHTLSAHDLNTIPEFGDDALRATNHLPGTASIGLSARPYIRGGLQDETLVLFNGVELLEPFHLKDFQSVFSGFNPSLVESVDVYTGGFPARYGNRMSGVMDIKPTIDINGLGVDVLVSFLTTSAALKGSSQDGRSKWALSARRGNLDLVLDVLDPKAGEPRYSDYYGSFRYALTPTTEIETGFIFYDDDVELKDLDEGDGELARSIYKNGYGWVQLHRQWSERMDSSTVLSYGNIKNDRAGFINDEDLEEGSSSIEDHRRFELWHLGHRQFWKASPRLGLEFGARLNYQQGSYDTLSVIERGELGDLIGLPATEVRRVDEQPRGTSGGFYGSLRYLPRDWLSLQAGLRWDYQDYAEQFEQHVSPRLSALLNLGSETELRFSLGRFYQAEQIHELQAADGVAAFQAAQYADHYILGLQHTFADSGLSLRMEGFHKRFRHPKRRFENLFNALVLMPELASDRIRVAPDKARAQGIELSLAYQPSRRFNTWLAYTHAYADDELDGQWVQRGWDQRHTVSSGIVWEPGNWTLSGALLWHSGWQTTLLPPSVGEDELPNLQRNAGRLPDYLSVDLKLSRTWRWPEQSLTVFLELTNALNRDNVGAYEYDVEENEGGEGFLLPREAVTLLPRMPSLGLRWTFN